ncbi:MAG: hypothetical protein PHY50_05130 [Sideroxydans sp.]|nr:hypothetical protein [Sideroxydans sp.]
MRILSSLTIALLSITTVSPSLAAGNPTETGNELAISLGFYRYEEPGLMSLQGIKSGFDLRTTKAYPARHTFLRGELRYAGGTVDYNSNSTGSSSGEPDWYFEGRALIGNDWLLKESTVSVYTGFGYRFLFNDGRGITSTGAAGYRRESTYFYLPVGVSFRTGLSSGHEMIGSFEYDHLLSGNQFTKLSDTGLGYSDLSNKQTDGYGMKLRISYVTAEWSAGPYLHYWNIAESSADPIYRYGVLNGSGVEPYNKTTEIGLELRRPF